MKRAQVPGVPQAVGRPRSMGPALDVTLQRQAWLLDLLAFARHGAVAARVDLHGPRASHPPMVLDLPDRVVGLDFAEAVRALKSRPRSFSQIAGRYAHLQVGAHHRGVPLVLEIWEPEGTILDGDFVLKTAEPLARYLQADVRVLDAAAARQALQGRHDWPEAMLQRNPLAWFTNWRNG